MKRALLLLAFASKAMASDVTMIIPQYPDPTGFYEHYHCTGHSLYDICPTRLVVNYHIDSVVEVEAPKQIHLPRTDTRAQMRKIDPNEDYRYSYRIQ